MSDRNRRPEMTYEGAGVSIKRANQAVEWLKPLAASTYRPEVKGGIGGFAGAFQVGDTELLAGADGVGSKLLVALAENRLDTIGIDLVAMNVNDVLAAGGEPLFFLDYIALGRLVPERVRELVQGIVQGCREAGCTLLGGETAELPDLYRGHEFDLSGFAVGRRVFRPEPPRPGDIVLGLASAGFHSNGYQLIRTVIRETGHHLSEPIAEMGHRTLGEVLLTPTRIYVKPVMALWQRVPVRAMAHITGGGIMENLPRTLLGLGAEIDPGSWSWPVEMRLVQEWGGIKEIEMLRTFNAGIGYTVVVPKDFVQAAQDILSADGIASYAIGRVIEKSGVTLR